MLPGTAYGRGVARVAPGDLVVLYSDGITEATDAAGNEFGLARLESSLRAAAGLSATELVKRVIEDVKGFLDHEKPHDDQSILVLRRTVA
jgi:sigma-B regulation protein RsbU (phosphoserine phosphatase)